MKPYKQLTTEQRYHIYGLKQSGLNQTQIALHVGVNKSTISREFKRNKGKRGWRPRQAQVLCDSRKQACNNGKRFSSIEWGAVEQQLRNDLSPEQISNRFKLEENLQISHEATTRLLTPFKDMCHTITFDNGKEFAEHERIASELQTSIYFAHPYHSWERGLNENSNGLLRQYFPKNMKLNEITEEQVKLAVERLNHRPRKVLGFRSPYEVFFGVEMCYTKPPPLVALRT